MLLVWLIAGSLLLVAFAGLMSAAEAAISVKSRADILALAIESRSRTALVRIAEDTGTHVNALSFVRITTETTAAVLVTLAFSFSLESLWLALVLSALLMTAVSFVLVGASPRGFGRNNADVILQVSAPIVHAVRVVLGPLADALVTFGNRVTPGVSRNSAFASEEQLLSMVDEATELAVLEEDERALIHSIFEFNQTVIREVMVPRTDMIVIDAGETIQEATGVFLRTGVSRLPVIDDDIDEVVGILYLKDVARIGYETPDEAGRLTAGAIAKPALFVPESKKADSLLAQMQAESNHLAIVIDEYGGVAGLVTIEDLIEELVGEISDEYDTELDEVVALEVDAYRVSARLAIDELGELYGIELEDDDVDTVGGLLTKHLGRLPTAGDEVTANGLVLVAERVEGRRKRLVTVVVRPTEALDEIRAALAREATE
ncbi:HlyC/CorC family transporter [Labedella phragmitis]|uniref:HlyC/CorC family transporter n=1 Tax=Labedella phragmitis TaxID=2498849 RepID=A0A3S3ZR88_9MICO|nr:hemolysin family protein [Labedella phragmitis]RWZ51844.1 HlyC/CorC family transporter [Labedella phragmitis]